MFNSATSATRGRIRVWHFSRLIRACVRHTPPPSTVLMKGTLSYEEFYESVCCISILAQGFLLQSMLVDQMNTSGKTAAADWWEKEWTEEENGKVMLANGKIGLIDNNIRTEALDIYEEFHILEALPQKWSKYHLFKCNYPISFKTVSCAHVLLASMVTVCDRGIEVPIQYWSASLQHLRRGPGRPTAKGAGRNKEERAVAGLKCRDKAGLNSRRKTYKVPTVSSFNMGVTCSVLIITYVAELERI